MLVAMRHNRTGGLGLASMWYRGRKADSDIYLPLWQECMSSTLLSCKRRMKAAFQ